jgi:hypothetical protein
VIATRVEPAPSGPEAAQQLRMITGDLWLAIGNRSIPEAQWLLRQLSREVERLARQLESAAFGDELSSRRC